MPEGRLNIIALAGNRWDYVWMNRQQLLSRLAPKHNILYSTGLWSSWDRKKPAFRQAKFFGEISKSDGVIVDQPPKYLLRIPRLALLERRVIKRAANRWRKILHQRNEQPMAAYLFHPSYYPYVEALKPDFLVYHAYDFYRSDPAWTSQLEHWENELLHHADLAIVQSAYSARKLQTERAKELMVLSNGADFEAFSNGLATNIPDDLAAIPSPRIGYAGKLNRKVDFALIFALAKSAPDQHWVLIGIEDEIYPSDQVAYDGCRALTNVHFLGYRERDRLPSYVAHMDINVMVYRSSEDVWAHAGSPIKMHEYLATGKPVVSTRLEAVEEFSEVIDIADGVDDWSLAIERALHGQAVSNFERRQQVASENTWDARVEKLAGWLQAM